MTKEMSEFHLADRARRRYEQLKNKTKIDIRDTWENLLNTSTVLLKVVVLYVEPRCTCSCVFFRNHLNESE
ncbi:hypothetical protein EB796_019944 [Bugula neritina]|uniref:Uncharacterized protein n=1 Tax=Bugula neritina TaxID=10212 RepID=A0A7J7J670_BUGNE|nr:hypothetical protein EB796_019944 [Bugula neritina]